MRISFNPQHPKHVFLLVAVQCVIIVSSSLVAFSFPTPLQGKGRFGYAYLKTENIISRCFQPSIFESSSMSRTSLTSSNRSTRRRRRVMTFSSLHMAARGSYGRSSSRRSSGEFRSKRQERVGHVVRTELAQILQSGLPIRYTEYLEEDLRRTINIVNADVSPDLRQARITVSMIGKESATKRRIFAWLVGSTKQIRHKLSQNLKHMKTVPNISFVLADVGAAVDVMNLLDRIVATDGKYKRDSIGWDGAPEGGEDFDEEGGDASFLPSGMFGGLDFSEDGEDDDGWIDEEDEFLDDDEEEEFLDDDDEEEEESDDSPLNGKRPL